MPNNLGGTGDSKVTTRGPILAYFLPVGPVNVPERSQAEPPIDRDLATWFFGAMALSSRTFPGPIPPAGNVRGGKTLLELTSAVPGDPPAQVPPFLLGNIFGEERVDFKYDFGSRWR